jgi:hypothetical protein
MATVRTTIIFFTILEKKPFNSKRGGFNKHRNKNFGNRRDNSNVNVPINDNDFPPLNNEEGNSKFL